MKRDQLIKIGNHTIGEGYPCFIIGEAGCNHNGNLDLAKQLVDVAVEAGVDAVKFQSFKTEVVCIADVEKAPYQKKTTAANEPQNALLKRLEMNKAFHVELINYCKEKKIMFFSTCADESGLDLLIELDVPLLKIASMDTVNPMFLEKIAKTGKPVILATGMSTQTEMEQAYQCLRDNGCKDLALLKCTSCYPTLESQVNLRGLKTMQEQFDAIIGFSDHTVGLGASAYAVAMGARIIEKHFTTDKNLPGPDHQASLSPDELTLLVKEIRKVEQMLGSEKLCPTPCEQDTIKALRKCLVSRVELKKGQTINRNNITAKRTGAKGIPSSDFYKVLGTVVTCDLPQDQPIHWSYLGK